MTAAGPYRVRLAAAARQDIEDILAASAERFGDRQARRYARLIADAIEDCARGRAGPLLRHRDEVRPGLASLHLARRGRPARHVLFLRLDASAEPPTIDIVRVLHDAMDPRRHLEDDRPRG